MKTNEQIFMDCLLKGIIVNKRFYSYVIGTGSNTKIGPLRDHVEDCIQDLRDLGYMPYQLQDYTFGLGISTWDC